MSNLARILAQLQAGFTDFTLWAIIAFGLLIWLWIAGRLLTRAVLKTYREWKREED